MPSINSQPVLPIKRFPVHMGYCYNNNCIHFHAIYHHVWEAPSQAAAQPRYDTLTALRKNAYASQGMLNFFDKKPAKPFLFGFVPCKRIIKLDLGRLKKAYRHGLYFSNTSAAETDLISPAL